MRIKQVLTNNYPMDIIEREIHKFMNKVLPDTPRLENTTPPLEPLTFYYQNQMTSNYKTDEKKLKSLFSEHIHSVNEDSKVELVIFYKTKKLRSLFIKNKITPEVPLEKKHHVVYQYKCNREGCNTFNPTYIGYTTCTLYDRFGMHTQGSSSIKKHLTEAHSVTRVARRDLLESVKVLKHITDKRQLIMTEAILIKELKPSLNTQAEGCSKILKIFKH